MSTRTAVAVAAVAVPVFLMTGCAATTTSGHAAGGTTATTAPVTGGDCVQRDVSAAAAGATVHCYVTALAAGDTTAACSVLSRTVREHLARRSGDDSDGAFHVPTSDGSADLDGDCATVAPLMTRALDQLSGTQRGQLSAALRQARVGAARVTGTAASVDLTISASGRTGTQSVALVQDSGSWKIDSAGAFAVAG